MRSNFRHSIPLREPFRTALFGAFNWDAYWANHTNLWLRDRSGLIILDDFGNDAKILPVAFKGNGATYYKYTTGNLLSSNDWVLYLDYVLDGAVDTQEDAFLCQMGMNFRMYKWPLAGWMWTISDGVNNRTTTISYITLPIENRKYTWKIIHDQDGNTLFYENGVLLATKSGVFTNIANGINYIGSRGSNPITNTTYLNTMKIYSDLDETILVAHYEFTGGVTKEYDLSGNDRDLDAIAYNTTARGFCTDGTDYLLDNGWSLWQKSGSADIYVPYGGITTAPDSGYTLTKDYLGSAIKLNMAPCLIGFNENGVANSELEIFDRSNIIRQTATSRASAYYDATNLATKSRYHISEIYPHEVFTTLFESAYQDIVFISISKTGADFSITEFIECTEKQTGGALANRKLRSQIDKLLTVGIDKNVRTINQAITRAYDDYMITIDIGTYNETLDLTIKKLNFVGTGDNNTIIFFNDTTPSNLLPTIDIATNSTFTNIYFDRRMVWGVNAKPIINIDACNPVFINCRIGKLYLVDAYNSRNPMTIKNGSNVTMSGCIVESINAADVQQFLSVEDTSKLIFEGKSFAAHLYLKDTAEAHIDTDLFYTDGADPDEAVDLYAEDDSRAYIKINTREISWDYNTMDERVAGIYSGHGYFLYDNAYLELSGNQIISGPLLTGAGIVCLFKDIISTLGHFWIETIDVVNATAVVTFDHCSIYFDANNDNSGYHIIEMLYGECRIINGSILEFSGHNGNWFTMGNPISCSGKLMMRNSTIIDNVNDNIPFGVNYQMAISLWNQLDIEDSVITNQNWDSLGVNTCINLQKKLGTHLQIRLKNVIFNNDEINTCPINCHFESPVDANDYICAENLTNNSIAGMFSVDNVEDLVTYADLLSHCP